MAVVPATVFTNPDARIRVCFDDGTHGWQQLTPDQRIAAVGYAMMAGNVADRAITSAKIALGAVTGSNIASGPIRVASSQNDTGEKKRGRYVAPLVIHAATLVARWLGARSTRRSFFSMLSLSRNGFSPALSFSKRSICSGLTPAQALRRSKGVCGLS